MAAAVEGSGEIVVTEVPRVLRFHPGQRGSGEYGTLVVTNYRIAFIPANADRLAPPENDLECIPLTSVARLYAILKGKEDGRVSLSKGIRTSQIEHIEVATKDFHVHRFGVQFVAAPTSRRLPMMADSPIKKLAATLLRHCFPATRAVLFALDYRPAAATPAPELDLSAEARQFRAQREALLNAEMTRCGIQGDPQWTITQNLQFMICHNYPSLLVVPAASADDLVLKAAPAWRDSRFVAWRWSSRRSGAWLARSGKLDGKQPEARQCLDNFAAIGKGMVRVNAAAAVSAAQAEAACNKLAALCHDDTLSNSDKKLDSGWMSDFADTRWPAQVQSALSAAVSAARSIDQDATNVLIIGGGGRAGHADVVLSSLVQLMLDPHFRTFRGFGELIQKEWESMGFPFLSVHLTPIRKSGPKQHALFALFLDCVHQITKQFQASFEYTSQYLVHVYRASLGGRYNTFIFDSDKDRMCPEFFASSSFWESPVPSFFHRFTNVLYRSNPAATIPDAHGASIKLWAGCFFPQTVGALDQDDHIIRENLAARVDQIRAALAKTATGPEELHRAAEALGLPPILASAVALPPTRGPIATV